MIQHQQTVRDPVIPQFDEWPQFERWLFAKYSDSPGTRHRHHACMKRIISLANEKFGKSSFMTLTYDDWQDLFFAINALKANIPQKERYRCTANLFFRHLVKRNYQGQPKPETPIPDHDDFNFAPSGRQFVRSSITIAEVKGALSKLSLGGTGRLRSPIRPETDYFLLATQVTTGLRPGAVVSLHKSFIDFSTRKIEAGISLPGFHKKKQIVVPISLFIAKDFEQYMKRVPGEWVFPTPVESTYPFINTNYFRKICRRDISTWIGKRWHPHSGRGILNTARFLLGCEDSLREILLGQKPTGVNSQKYLWLRDNFDARRDFFDFYDPFLTQQQRSQLPNPYEKWQRYIG